MRAVLITLAAATVPAALTATLIYNQTGGCEDSGGAFDSVPCWALPGYQAHDWTLTLVGGLAVLLVPPILVAAWLAVRKTSS